MMWVIILEKKSLISLISFTNTAIGNVISVGIFFYEPIFSIFSEALLIMCGVMQIMPELNFCKTMIDV